MIPIQDKLCDPIPNLLHSTSKHTPRICDNREPILNIKDLHPRIFIKSIYFEQHIPNSLESIYLRQNVYGKLIEAINLLPENYSFIVYDGYRPLQVQQHLFQLFSKKVKESHPNFTVEETLKETLKYVAFPSTESNKTSPHLTGGAVDLTLGDLQGNPLDLGSAFDEMSEKSETRYYECHPKENDKALKNRRLLYKSMITVGFTNYSGEWWHYDYGNVTWARRVNAQEAMYGAIESIIEDNYIKEFRYL